MSQILKVKNLTKQYGDIKALDDANLDVDRGVVTALIGPNGSGKTTLLKIMAGLMKQTLGTIFFEGYLITDDNTDYLRKNTTLVFQRPVMFSTSVFNNVAFGLKIRGYAKSEVKKKVDRALRLVHLKNFDQRNARKISGGEQRRVSLARAFALNPRLLLLDEPTANLDPRNSAMVEEVIQSFNKDLNTTVLVATHDMHQAKRLASKAAVLQEGKVVALGDIKRMFRRLSKPLASFIRPENLYAGQANPLEYGLSIIDLGNGVKIEAIGFLKDEVKVYIDPLDIVVSRSAIQSSARNKLWGRVVEASELNHQVQLKIDVGKTFTTIITKKSFEELKINIGSRVCVSFKSSSIKVL